MTSGRSPRRSARREKAVRIRCCTAAGCLSSGSQAVIEGLEAAVAQAGLGETRPGRRRRLPAALLRGAAGPGRPRRPALREGDAGRRRRRSSPPWTAGAADAAARRPGPPVLRAPDGRRAREQRPDRARADRVVHRGRRLPGPATTSLREMTPGRGRRGDHPQRPARPRRRGLPDGREVGHGRQAAGRAQVRRLQRRRGRPRRLHGPQRPGERPAPRPGGHGHRRLRRRREPGLHLRPRRVPAGDPTACRRPSSRPSGSACSAARSSSRRSTSAIDIRIGAGAFVCGEETALIASIEGKRGTPRPRPPYPAEEGLWGCPTLINNVETFANVPPIIRNGADWFAGIGTAKSKGTKVFALTGKIKNTGLVEVPMGTHAAADRRGDRRRRPRRRHDQGGADRRPLRRLHPRRARSTRPSTTSRWRSSARSWAPAA